jgi:hypothetical protein
MIWIGPAATFGRIVKHAEVDQVVEVFIGEAGRGCAGKAFLGLVTGGGQDAADGLPRAQPVEEGFGQRLADLADATGGRPEHLVVAHLARLAEYFLVGHFAHGFTQPVPVHSSLPFGVS